MRWKKYSACIEMTGITQKQTAVILSENFRRPFEYETESNRYVVKDNLDRLWSITFPEDVEAERISGEKKIKASGLFRARLETPFLYENDFDMLSDILERIEESGGLTNNSTKTEIRIDVAGVESRERFLKNLDSLENSKGRLFGKALGFEENKRLIDMSKIENENIISFPNFKSTTNHLRVNGYIQLCQSLSNYANKQGVIKDKENPSPNDKFVMRTFLVRMGMMGEEYKDIRQMLTKDLKGNSAWIHKVEVEEIEPQKELTRIEEISDGDLLEDEKRIEEPEVQDELKNEEHELEEIEEQEMSGFQDMM